ncbi:cation:proton antiporter [Roseomonas terrae]|uniref:Cation:proton antiporter n=1 Tax=Neoroseomonas terrae TaxID=424799 RepID=A0ABS5ECL1_9PROT|nr:cation:proton antiporter [Neoroseomonas terrae]MBR0648753.1 cation:proton antiporter [Neoroseomonas terrae]
MVVDQAGLEAPPLARFAILLLGVMAARWICPRLRLPECIGYILIGVLVGPHLIGIIPRHAEVATFFGEIGKLLLMFFVGLEIDLDQFARARRRALSFGVATFALPLAGGFAVGHAFGYSPVAALLIGSLIASHTLIAFPIVTAAGLSARPSVTVTVGATVLTDMLALLVLAACLTTHRSGFAPMAIVIQVGELIAFAVILLGIVGPLARRAVCAHGNSEQASFTLLLIVVSVAAMTAEMIQLEGIIGAFLAGIAVNQAVKTSSAKEKLEFLGNGVFIPAFFIVTGFLVDLRLLVSSLTTDLPLVLAIVLALLGTKWIAAEVSGRTFGFRATDRLLMASLTVPQVAATLAATLVGYEALNGAGERLLDGRMLNAVLVLVMVTAVVGPVLTERAVARLRGCVGENDTTQSPAASLPVQG